MAKRLSMGVAPRSSYPHPPFDQVIMRVVVKALRMAWAPISMEERSSLPGMERPEVRLNSEMSKEIDALRRSGNLPGFNSDVFDTVVVDAAIEDYAGNRVSSSPDITIRLRNTRPAVANPMVDAIFIECKRIRQGSNLGNYYRTGMSRFLDGQYAWAVSQGVMVGYVETNQELPDALQTRLERMDLPIKTQVIPYKKDQIVRPSGKPYAAFTKHHRSWLHPNDDKPGDIELTHVWLWYYG